MSILLLRRQPLQRRLRPRVSVKAQADGAFGQIVIEPLDKDPQHAFIGHTKSGQAERSVARLVFFELVIQLEQRFDNGRTECLDGGHELVGNLAVAAQILGEKKHRLRRPEVMKHQDERFVENYGIVGPVFEPEPDHNEELVLRKLPFSELYGMVVRGEVRDSLTVAAVLRVKLMLEDGSLAAQK